MPTLAAAFALAAGGLALGAAAPVEKRVVRNWNTVVTVTPEDTHILGNPAAKVRLTEFISYTCPHCAHFEVEADAPLRVGFVAGGNGAVEVRHFIRDPVDMTVALLTNCGPASKFFLNHAAFLRNQSRWIAPLTRSSAAQRSRWTSGRFVQRTRAIAKDFGFYRIMASRGYSAVEVDKCLANEALANRLALATAEAQTKLLVRGTPTFALDGVVLAGTASWDALRPQIEARLRPQ
jgi:protein-disulfide isomerase